MPGTAEPKSEVHDSLIGINKTRAHGQGTSKQESNK